ncbi:MAG: hypothetical protein J6Q40_06710 [Tidjanibacter sp.]|nr:hypothetical protein [Tidjanibacter sp.]
MEEYNDDYYDYNEEKSDDSRSLKGYKVLVIILVVILAALSFLYFKQTHQMREDFRIERDTLTNRIVNLITDIDNIQTANDTITQNLNIERQRADSLMQRLQKERSANQATIRRYEKEIGTLLNTMQHYVKQIDSLNTLNQQLASENITIRRQVTSERLRADKAEERASELDDKVRMGSIVKARDITLTPINATGKPVTRATRADRLKIDFILSANELTQPGSRNVYARIIGPDGYIMANTDGYVFDFEGDQITYSAMRDDVDYQNEDLAIGLYYGGAQVVAGEYQVEIYMDGYMIGESSTLIR